MATFAQHRFADQQTKKRRQKFRRKARGALLSAAAVVLVVSIGLGWYLERLGLPMWFGIAVT
ncbi:MAG: hypothetical protein LC808_26960, partial [Actinobacteria bacterium]|nr:hypothetical protein [Actinomycetota bacterium]